MQQISATELAQWLQTSPDHIFLLDVREPNEFAIGHIAGSVLQPMQTIPNKIEEIRSQQGDKSLVCICHHGGRSMQVAHFLVSHGLTRIFNLSGGVNAWSLQVDASLPRY